MNPVLFLAALANTEYEPRTYSGRGMYGKQCVGVCIESAGDAFLMGARLALELGEEPPVPCVDSMGRGLIAYWPSIEMEEVGDDSDSEETSDSL
jgi:hypothetical protein